MADELTIKEVDQLLKKVATEGPVLKKDEEGKTPIRKGIDKAKDIASTAVGLGAGAVGAAYTLSPKYTEMKTI